MNVQNLPSWLPVIIIVLAVWTIPWKGVALWKAARREEKIWFIALLLLNTVAVLEILYIVVVAKEKKQPEPSEPIPNP